jgi:hypothetical protein
VTGGRWPAALAPVVIFAAVTVRADMLTPTQINFETLLEAATNELATVVEFFGPDGGVRLPFTGTVSSSVRAQGQSAQGNRLQEVRAQC